jgi:hypothetical protein
MSSSQSSGYLEKSSEPRLLLPFRVMDGRERDKKEREKGKSGPRREVDDYSVTFLF